jgi:hypothetical protein
MAGDIDAGQREAGARRAAEAGAARGRDPGGSPVLRGLHGGDVREADPAGARLDAGQGGQAHAQPDEPERHGARPAGAKAPRKAPAKKSASDRGAPQVGGLGGGDEPVSAQPGPPADEPDPWGLNSEAPPVSVVKAATPKKKAPSKATPEGLEWLALIERYFVAYERVRGVRPLFDGADARAMQRLLEKAGKDHDRAGRIIERAFADSWWGPKVTIREIASNAARFDGNGPARHFGSHMQAPAKNPDGSIKKPKLVNLDD